MANSSDLLTGLPPSYTDRMNRLAIVRDAATARWNRLANLRLLGAGVVLVSGLTAVLTGSWVPVAPALIAGAVFVWLVIRHRQAGRERAWAIALFEINREGEARQRRAWNELPLRNDRRAAASHPYAADLDVFGPASVMHLLETVETAMGADTLAAWLSAPAAIAEIGRRQSAVGQLAPEQGWRQRLAAHGRLIGNPKPDPAPFLRWAEQLPLLAGRGWLPWAGRLGTLAFVAAVALDLVGPISWPAWLGAALFNVAIVQLLGGESRARIRVLAEQHDAIERYADLLGEIEHMPGDAPLLVEARASLTPATGTATYQLARLRRISTWVVPPSSIVYFLLQAAVAWDVHLLDALERWQRDAGASVRGWLSTLGEVETLSAMATLAADNPTWVFPTLDLGADRVCAKALAHPLLPPGRVANDVELGPPGSYLLVTGSNMSGKSTLLRAIGVNLVLANMGGPVCAGAFRCPPARLWTSVHIEDSLANGVSFFMAELQRLKAVVDASEQPDPGGRMLVYLLDEILQGTNTAERQIAARRVIRTLVDNGAIGAVSTHDLTLAEGAELSTATVPVHLREEFDNVNGRPTMTFDYKLRPGLATSTNALTLMEIVFGQRGQIRQEASPVVESPD